MATTPSKSDTRTPRRRRRFPRVRKYASIAFGMLFKILGIGATLFAILFMGPELTEYYNSGMVFTIPLAYVSFQIVRDHKRLGTTKKWMLAVPVIATAFAVYAAVMLLGHNTMPAFLGWLALFPLLLFMAYTLVYGTLYAIRYRKDEDAAFGGYLYLIAATLAFVVTAKLGFWFGPGLFAAYGNHFEQGSILAFLLIVCLTVRALAKRPDLVYDEDETPDTNHNTNPDNDPEARHPQTDENREARRPYFPLDDEDDNPYTDPHPRRGNPPLDYPGDSEATGPLPQLGPDGHPVDPSRTGTPRD